MTDNQPASASIQDLANRWAEVHHLIHARVPLDQIGQQADAVSAIQLTDAERDRLYARIREVTLGSDRLIDAVVAVAQETGLAFADRRGNHGPAWDLYEASKVCESRVT